MSASRVAIRYAKALVELLNEKNALDEVQTFLDFCDMAAAHPSLGRLFANVTVSAEDKAGIAAALAKKLALPETIARFLQTLAGNGRMGILPEVRAAVAQRLDVCRNVQSVELTCAVAPSDAEVDALKKTMEAVLGGQVRLETVENPDILGGAIARVGSVVYDGSVRGRLDRLRQELVKEN